MKFLLALFFLSARAYILDYTQKDDALLSYYPATPSALPYYGQNDIVHISANQSVTPAMLDENGNPVYNFNRALITAKSAVILLFPLESECSSQLDVLVNGEPKSANRRFGRYVLNVLDELHDFGEQLNADFEITIVDDAKIISVSSSFQKAPQLRIRNQVIYDDMRSWEDKVVQVTAGTEGVAARLDVDMQVGQFEIDCWGRYDSMAVLGHPHPSWHYSVYPTGKAISKNTERGERVCNKGPSGYGSGPNTFPVTGSPKADTPAVFANRTRGLWQAWWEQQVRPDTDGGSIPVDAYAFEYNSAHFMALALQNPGEIRDLYISNPAVIPCPPEFQSTCSYVPVSSPDARFSPKLNASLHALGIATAESGFIPCSKHEPINLEPYWGPKGLDETSPLFLTHPDDRLQGYCSRHGPLPDLVTSLQTTPDNENPSTHSTHGFFGFLACDAACGATQGYNIRCPAKLGTLGFGSAQGQEKLFSPRKFTNKMIETLNFNNFPGIGTDSEAAEEACASCAPGSLGTCEMIQPNAAQPFATTVTTNPFDPVPTFFGATAGQLEVEESRELHNWLVDSFQDICTSITGTMYILLPDHIYGRVITGPGTPEPLRFGLMPWLTDSEIVEHIVGLCPGKIEVLPLPYAGHVSTPMIHGDLIAHYSRINRGKY